MVNVSSGKSEVDRITFYDSQIGATAIQHSDGEIEIKYEKKDVTLQQVLIVLGLFLFISLFKVFGIMTFIDNETSMVYLYLLPALFYFLLPVIAIKKVRKKGNENLLRNHGAEHMVFSAYKKLKRVPSIEEAKRFSRINRNCGVTLFSAFFTAQLIGFIVYKYADYQISEWILFLVPLFFGNFFPFNTLGKLAQFWTTSKPNDANINLAITAMSALERRYLLENLINSFVNELSKRL